MLDCDWGEELESLRVPVAQLRRSHGGRLRLQSLLSPKAHARLSEIEGTVAVLKPVFKDFKQAKLHGFAAGDEGREPCCEHEGEEGI